MTSDYSIFEISDEASFESKALEIFNLQYENVATYRKFCDALKRRPDSVDSIESIPFLPIEFFKSQSIIANDAIPQISFSSSGTTGMQTSKHHLADVSLYQHSFLRSFELFLGAPEDLVILALLPSYLEREGSSLVYMVDRLIRLSGHPESGFYIDNTDELRSTLMKLEERGQPALLIGVSFALLDLVENESFELKSTLVMETGGMKGRRKELIRTELHSILKSGFGVKDILSEYGMTELLSQAYSLGNGLFGCPPWMKVLTRHTEDPFEYVYGKTGGLNIIDLANQHSCSFIATQDLGKLHSNGSFEILGRFDHSDIRGCNLMVL